MGLVGGVAGGEELVGAAFEGPREEGSVVATGTEGDDDNGVHGGVLTAPGEGA